MISIYICSVVIKNCMQLPAKKDWLLMRLHSDDPAPRHLLKNHSIQRFSEYLCLGFGQV